MRHILGEDGLRCLESLAASRTLVGLDFDGSLAPIVADRDRAAMRRHTRELLVRLSALYPCAVISGRARVDVEKHLGGAGAGVKHVIGNHGIEPCQGMDSFAVPVAQAFRYMTEKLDGRGDVDLEWKRYSFAVHYRRAHDRDEAEQELRALIDTIPCAMKIIPGKLVLNVVPAGAPNKGDALRHLKRIENAESAIFIGDDVTDEDAFQLHRTGEVVGVRVGEAEGSAAAYFLRDQGEVDGLLEKLVELRADPATGKPPGWTF